MLIYYSIFILLFSLSLQASDFCNSYSTCFSFNWQFNCEWSSTECKSLNESKRESSWLSSVNLCSNGSNATNQYTIPFTINYTFLSSDANTTQMELCSSIALPHMIPFISYTKMLAQFSYYYYLKILYILIIVMRIS